MNIRRRPPNPSIKVANLEYAIPHSESQPKNILEKIVWEKAREVEIDRQKIPLEKLKELIVDLPKTKPFLNSLLEVNLPPAVIAEIKKASPSKGVIRKDFNPIEIAKLYEEGGASCLSVLTEKNFFQGNFEILRQVRRTVDLPLLCKDFIFTPYQIYQAREAGADAVLLIAAILSDQDLKYLKKIASSLELEVLVEVHDHLELERILQLKIFSLVGINNRDLKTFETNLGTTEDLASTYRNQLKSQDILLVSESGLFDRKDLNRVSAVGAKAVLVGESLMRKADVKKGLCELING